MDREQLARAFAELTVEERADVLMAIVCSITGKVMPQRKFSSKTVSVITAVLYWIK